MDASSRFLSDRFAVESQTGEIIQGKVIGNEKKNKLKHENFFEIITAGALQLKVKNITSYNFILHIYMLKYFMQVKCDWYRMEATVLIVKRNNCKTLLPEAASGFILPKIVHQIPQL